MYVKDISQYQSDKFVTYYEQDLTSSALEKSSFLVVANGTIDNKQLLNNVLSGVKNGGFFLTVERQFDPKFRQVGVDVIAKYSDGEKLYILLKKVISCIRVLICINKSINKKYFVLNLILEHRCTHSSYSICWKFILLGRVIKTENSKR